MTEEWERLNVNRLSDKLTASLFLWSNFSFPSHSRYFNLWQRNEWRQKIYGVIFLWTMGKTRKISNHTTKFANCNGSDIFIDRRSWCILIAFAIHFATINDDHLFGYASGYYSWCDLFKFEGNNGLNFFADIATCYLWINLKNPLKSY